MVRLYGSYNGRYFVVQLGNEVRIHRGGSLQWIRPVSGVRETLAVGNNGEVFFRTDAGLIMRLPFERTAEVTRVDLLRVKPDDPVKLGKLRINADGREFCYEKIVPEKKLSEKIFRLLRSKKSEEASTANHSLNLLNPRSGEVLSFFSAVVTNRQDERFLWEISPYFIYLVVGQTEKKGLVFQIINIPDKAVTGEFEMQVSEIHRAWINDQGTVMLEVKREDGNVMVIVSSKDKWLLTPPPNYKVLHLGPDWVAFQTEVDPHIIVRRFDNSPVVQADIRPLGKLGMEYRFLVNDRGDMDVLTFSEDTLSVHHSDFRNLETDSKRWDLLARQMVSQEENTMARRAIEQHEEKARQMAWEEKQRELMTDVRRNSPAVNLPLSVDLPAASSPPVPARIGLDLAEPEPPPSLPLRVEPEPPRPAIPSPVASSTRPPALEPTPAAAPLSGDDVTRELEKLQMHYIAGEIGREEYYRRKAELEGVRKAAAPPPPPTPRVLEIETGAGKALSKTSEGDKPSGEEPSLLQGPRLDLGTPGRRSPSGDGSH